LPQPEDGEYPGREFDEAPEESTSAAPTMLRTSVKHADIEDIDRVEDSEELGDGAVMNSARELVGV
jgi:hypothetical protein